jgi:hypothetical protein
MIRIVEIYTKGCPSCDYIYRLQKRLDMYDKLEHIENGTQEERFAVTQVPTIFVLINDKIINKYENVDRGTVEYIKKFYL